MAIQLSGHWIQKAHSITPAILMKLSPADKPSLDKSITIQTAKSCLVLENTILSASGQQLATPILFFIFPFFQTLAAGLCCVVFACLSLDEMSLGFFCTPPSSLSCRRNENKYPAQIGKTFHAAQETYLHPSFDKANLYARVWEAVAGKVQHEVELMS